MNDIIKAYFQVDDVKITFKQNYAAPYSSEELIDFLSNAKKPFVLCNKGSIVYLVIERDTVLKIPIVDFSSPNEEEWKYVAYNSKSLIESIKQHKDLVSEHFPLMSETVKNISLISNVADDCIIHIFTDAGYDDYLALSYILENGLGNNVKALYITCTSGNTNVKNVYYNVCTLIKEYNPAVPVYIDVHLPSRDEYSDFFGKDGVFGEQVKEAWVNCDLSNLCYPEYILNLANPEAVNVYMQHTNKVKHIISMLGATTKDEYNFDYIPEASREFMEKHSGISMLVTAEFCETFGLSVIDTLLKLPKVSAAFKNRLTKYVQKMTEINESTCGYDLLAGMLFSSYVNKDDIATTAGKYSILSNGIKAYMADKLQFKY